MTPDITAEKKQIREKMLAVRRAMSPAARAAADCAIAEQVTALPVFQAAKQVFAYVSMPHEVGTESLLNAVLSAGKRLGLPVCRTKTHQMDFYRLDALTELTEGAYRIPVPPEAPDRLLIPDADTLVIVPMLALDANGYRIGAGGGYYDRFLTAHPEVHPVGICYAECLTDALPHDIYDKQIACCITQRQTEEHHAE